LQSPFSLNRDIIRQKTVQANTSFTFRGGSKAAAARILRETIQNDQTDLDEVDRGTHV